MYTSQSGMKKIFGLLLTGLLVFLTVCSTLGLSAGCVPRSEWSPGHAISPYMLNLSFPAEKYHDGRLWATPGETVILTANIISLIGETFAVKVIRADTLMPCSPYITFQSDDEYTTLQPSDNITVTVFCTVAGNTPSGVQKTGLRCRMKDSISGMAGSGVAFDVYIE
jgi:hypothetical protein